MRRLPVLESAVRLDGRPAFPIVFAVIGTLLAGYCNGIGFVALGQLYVSFMSGNSAHMGFAIAAGDVGAVLFTLGVIITFVLGVWLATLITDAGGERFSLLSIIAVELGLAGVAFCALLAGSPAAMGYALVGMMGMHGVMHQTVSGRDFGRGFVTGALFSAGQALARLARPGSRGIAIAGILSWFGLAVGVAMGAATLGTVGAMPALVPIPIVLILLGISLFRMGPVAVNR